LKLPQPKNSWWTEGGIMADCQKRVFIVDDDGGVGRALMILLTSYGFRAEAFASAKDFFISVPAGCPGCLILDIHMPGADGWKTLAQYARSE
jgi:FixJ family two-component response regulator